MIFDLTEQEKQTIVDTTGFSVPTTEEEYWFIHRKYKKKLNRLQIDALSHAFKFELLAEKFEVILLEMVCLGIVSEDWAVEQLNNFYSKLNKTMSEPSVKERVKKYLLRMKRKFKK